jgi:hypothetical protein
MNAKWMYIPLAVLLLFGCSACHDPEQTQMVSLTAGTWEAKEPYPLGRTGVIETIVTANNAEGTWDIRLCSATGEKLLTLRAEMTADGYALATYAGEREGYDVRLDDTRKVIELTIPQYRGTMSFSLLR